MDRLEAVELLENCVEDNNYSDYHKALRMAIEALKQPEIVHCGECGLYYLVPSGRRRCSLHCTYTKPDDFCSLAERRTE